MSFRSVCVLADAELSSNASDPSYSLHLRMMIALAFVPSDKVLDAFEEIDGCPFVQQNKAVLDVFLDYFVNTWIGGFDRRGNRKSPMFAISRWNCYDSVLNDMPKTNNFCEGFHRGFSSLLSVHHPTLPKFVQGLMKQNTISSFRLELFNAGKFEVPLKEFQQQALRLKSAVQRYNSVPILDYLRGVAHCLKY